MSPLKPMLAMDYSKRGKSIVYPAYVQPKLDGIRVIAHRRVKTNDVIFYSREGNKFATLNHLITPILSLLHGNPFDFHLDGEAYVHGMSMEDISSAVKRNVPNRDSLKIQYWIYDFVSEKQFEMRNELLTMWAKNNNEKNLIFLPACRVMDESAMFKAHERFNKAGFEGTMIRNADASYAEKRSINLQKFKDFQDNEFEIIGTKECTGKDEGLIKFVCVTEGGVEFDVEPMGDDDSRREMWKKRDEFIGKKLTVKFQNYTNGGAPRFPNGVAVRDYE